jgi:hypothetical protein
MDLAFSNRRVASLPLEGCSLLITEGLEFEILSWKELESCGCSKFTERHVSPYDWSKMGQACIDGLLSPKLQTRPLSLPDG